MFTSAEPSSQMCHCSSRKQHKGQGEVGYAEKAYRWHRVLFCCRKSASLNLNTCLFCAMQHALKSALNRSRQAAYFLRPVTEGAWTLLTFASRSLKIWLRFMGFLRLWTPGRTKQLPQPRVCSRLICRKVEYARAADRN